MSPDASTQTSEPIALLGNDAPAYEIDYVDPTPNADFEGESRLREVMSGNARVNPLVAFLLAAVATVLVAGPLWLQARDVPPDPAVLLPGGITVATTDDDRVRPLHRSVIDELASIRFIGNQTDAVAFTLVDRDGAVISERVDLVGPDFDLLVDDDGEPLFFDTTSLDNGAYRLLVAVTDIEGAEAFTAADFTIANR